MPISISCFQKIKSLTDAHDEVADALFAICTDELQVAERSLLKAKEDIAFAEKNGNIEARDANTRFQLIEDIIHFQKKDQMGSAVIRTKFLLSSLITDIIDAAIDCEAPPRKLR